MCLKILLPFVLINPKKKDLNNKLQNILKQKQSKYLHLKKTLKLQRQKQSTLLDLTIVINPNAIKINNKVKPIVAPLINEKVLINPLLIADEIIITLTGPGDIDIAREKLIIVKNIVSVI